MTEQPIKKVVIAGGGTAGWMAAATLSKALGRSLDISLIESDEIPTVGVGEATIPPLVTLHKILGIDEKEFVAAVSGTFKLGIQFENWREEGHKYVHAFGVAGKDCWACRFPHFWFAGQMKGMSSDYGDYSAEHLAGRMNRFAVLPNAAGMHYAYHMDAGRYALFLRSLSEKAGVKRIEGRIDQANIDPANGYIKSLNLKSGPVIEGDFFIDCTGFRALLIEEALHSGYDDWSHWLLCDRAVAVQTESTGEPCLFTRSIAHEHGWQWRIPLQHRVGNGLVYCSRYMSDEKATEKLLSNVEGKALNEPKVVKFRTGTRRKHWNKNCVALGLASGFLEPLESTSIHLVQRNLIRLMHLFPINGIEKVNIDEFNKQSKEEIEGIRDFIILHYHVTNRTDSEFWRYCRDMPVPDSLTHRIKLFQETGQVVKVGSELFGEEAWTQVLLGQGPLPKGYHPIVDDLLSEDELATFLKNLRNGMRKKVEQLPKHQEFINFYCKAGMNNE